MEKNSTKLFIVLLAVAAILGFSLYSKSKTGSESVSPPIKSGIESTETTLKNEKDVLAFSSENASDEALNELRQKVISLAKSVEVVEISNCLATPVVAKVKDGESIIVKNLDNTNIKLFIWKDTKEIDIPSRNEVKINPSAYYKGRKGNNEVIRYRCKNQSQVFSGIFLITDVQSSNNN